MIGSDNGNGWQAGREASLSPTLREQVCDPELLPALPQCPETLQALPEHLKAFQAKWLLSGCSDEVLRIIRETTPEIIAFRVTDKSYRYSRETLCRIAKLEHWLRQPIKEIE